MPFKRFYRNSWASSFIKPVSLFKFNKDSCTHTPVDKPTCTVACLVQVIGVTRANSGCHIICALPIWVGIHTPLSKEAKKISTSQDLKWKSPQVAICSFVEISSEKNLPISCLLMYSWVICVFLRSESTKETLESPSLMVLSDISTFSSTI